MTLYIIKGIVEFYEEVPLRETKNTSSLYTSYLLIKIKDIEFLNSTAMEI